MATTPLEVLQNALVRPFTVASGQAVTLGKPVKFASADTEVLNAAATTDDVIGIALETGAAGAQVRVALLGVAIARVLVGTGGATRGAKAKWVSDGIADATVGGGTTKVVFPGLFMQSGVAGDYVGLLIGGAGAGVGS